MTKRPYIKFLFSLIFLLLSFEAFSEDDNKTIINIENAQNTRYEKDKNSGNDMIILSGNVKLSVTKGSNKNVISADVIRYDRDTEMLYAEGNVSLEQTTENSGGQTVTAASLMFNTSTLEGIFDDGRVVQTKSDAINLPSGSTLIVASDIFGRSESNTIAFKKGVLTFCDDENPHWNIKASRIWLLPGGEFAFLNALLFVGPVPVFYLPAFYYPKDELIFNPVFGYKPRPGYFIQTTTYIVGRKPLDTSSTTDSTIEEGSGAEKAKALFNFVKPSVLKEQKHEGLMMRNLDKDFSGDTSKYIKILGDYYANIGFLVGVDGVLKPNSYISNLEFGLQLGFSDTVFRDGDSYAPYGKSGEKYYEKSNFVGMKLPFRHATNIKFTLSKPFSLSLSFPVYSDPFFKNDFQDERQESMDWISFLIDSQSKDSDKDKTINEVSSFSWTLNGSYTIPLPKIINPYISSLSFTFNSNVAFSTRTVNGDDFDTSDIDEKDIDLWKIYTSSRKFYYPSQITPLTFSATLSGTLLDFSSKRAKSVQTNNPPEFAIQPLPPENFMTKDQLEKLKNANEAVVEPVETTSDVISSEVEKSKDISTALDVTADTKLKEEQEKLFLNANPFPLLTATSDSSTQIPGLDFSMRYSVKPSLSTQLAYSSEELKTAEDFDWGNMKSSMYTVKVPITLDNNLSYAGSFFNFSNSYTFEPVFQAHPYIREQERDASGNLINVNDGGYSPDQIKSLKKTDYASEKRDLTNTNSISIKPFYYIPLIKDTGVAWRTTIRLIRTEFLADQFDREYDAQNNPDPSPEWKYHTADWEDKDSITTNALDFTLGFNELEGKFAQNFTFTSVMKPQAEAYYGTLRLTFPYITAGLEMGIKKSSTEDDAEWEKQPLQQSFTFSFFNNTLKFSESYNYNMEDEYHDSLKLSLSWKNLSASYQMSYTNGYDFYSKEEAEKTEGKSFGWNQRPDKEFLPYSFNFSFSPPTKTIYTWKNRISLGLGLSTSISLDLLKPTSSYFTFSPSISLKIHEFLTFTFSATSRNSSITSYFRKQLGYGDDNVNFFEDLLNSFRFDDESLREASNFKLKSLNFDITHELHDWDFKFSFKYEPRIVTKTVGTNTKKMYADFMESVYMTLSIVWRPMSAMKAEMIKDYDKGKTEWQLK